MLPTVLMLPGTLCDERIFAAQRRSLRGQANLVCASYCGMKDRSHWLHALLRHLPAKFFIAGFSLGGLLALELLRIARARVQGIALIASNAQRASLQAQRKSAALHRMWRSRGPQEVARHVKPAYFHHQLQRQKHAQLVFDMAIQTPRRSAFEEFSWAAQRPSGLQTLGEFKGAVLIVSGRYDRLCPPNVQRAMVQAQPRAQWCEIARCGHFVPLEASARLSYILQSWIKQLHAA